MAVKRISTLRIRAYAKINLFLEVLGKSVDREGYHDLKTIFHSIGIFDELSIRKRSDGNVLSFCTAPHLPKGDGNLAQKAAKLLMNSVKGISGVSIELRKKIPIAAGLGGGSADAAAVLFGMNQLFDLRLSLEELMHFGELLGADVPFCLMGGAAIGEGIGTTLTAIEPLEDVPLLIVNPGFQLSTAEVFSDLDLSLQRKIEDVKIVALTEIDGRLFLYNRMEEYLFPKYPLLGRLKDRLLRYSCTRGALMSGSGPTIFALMSDRENAEFVASELRDDFPVCTVSSTKKVGLEIY